MALLKHLATGALLSLITLPAVSADFYYGFRFGISKFDTNINNLTGTARLEENDFGFKLLAGMPLGNNMAIEVFYTDYGEVTLGGQTGDTFDLNSTTFIFTSNDSELSSGLTTYGLNGLYRYSINASQSLNARLGIMRWQNKFKVQSPLNSISSSEDDIELYWSLGFEQRLGSSLSLLFDYESLVTENIDLQSIGLNIIYQF